MLFTHRMRFDRLPTIGAMYIVGLLEITAHLHWSIMKLFVLINSAIGFLALVVALNTFLGMAFGPTQIARGLIALVIGATCLWISKQTIAEGNLHLRN